MSKLDNFNLFIIAIGVSSTFFPASNLKTVLQIIFLAYLLIYLFYIKPKLEGKGLISNAANVILLIIFLIAMILFFVKAFLPEDIFNQFIDRLQHLGG